MKFTKFNSQEVPLGPGGYVICCFQIPGTGQPCGKEVQDISREVSREYARCLNHRRVIINKEESIMATKAPKEKKERKVRTPGKPQRAIQWFQEQAAATKDTDKIRAAAEKEKYSPATITIQLGRLRGMGLLPKLESKAAAPKSASKKKLKATKARSFHPVPKPSQSHQKTAVA